MINFALYEKRQRNRVQVTDGVKGLDNFLNLDTSSIVTGEKEQKLECVIGGGI